MKKSSLFLLVIVTGVLFAGCGGNQETADSQDFASTDENTLTVGLGTQILIFQL